MLLMRGSATEGTSVVEPFYFSSSFSFCSIHAEGVDETQSGVEIRFSVWLRRCTGICTARGWMRDVWSVPTDRPTDRPTEGREHSGSSKCGLEGRVEGKRFSSVLLFSKMKAGCLRTMPYTWQLLDSLAEHDNQFFYLHFCSRFISASLCFPSSAFNFHFPLHYYSCSIHNFV